MVRGGIRRPYLGARDGPRPPTAARGDTGVGADVHTFPWGVRGDEADAEERAGRGPRRARRAGAGLARGARGVGDLRAHARALFPRARVRGLLPQPVQPAADAPARRRARGRGALAGVLVSRDRGSGGPGHREPEPDPHPHRSTWRAGALAALEGAQHARGTDVLQGLDAGPATHRPGVLRPDLRPRRGHGGDVRGGPNGAAGLRTILYTSQGGVGKTSVAAATALEAARSGKKVLVMSTDPAHSLSDAFDAEVGPEPKEMATGLFAQEMDYGYVLEEYWAEIQGYVTAFFEWQGADSLAAEELAMLPGMDELFGLLMVRRHHRENLYDALILDAAPTGETLRLLSLPDQMRWYVEKVFPVQRRGGEGINPLPPPGTGG